MDKNQVKELIRLASLVGTDAKRPEEELLLFVDTLKEKWEREAEKGFANYLDNNWESTYFETEKPVRIANMWLKTYLKERNKSL